MEISEPSNSMKFLPMRIADEITPAAASCKLERFDPAEEIPFWIFVMPKRHDASNPRRYPSMTTRPRERFMDIKALRYFIAAAQAGSITQAAHELRVAQPAVSRQLRKLEDELGARLLNRTAQGISLTRQGEHLLSQAAPVIQVLNRTRSEIRDWSREPSGPVSVALMPAVGSLVAPPLVERLRAEFPKLQLTLTEGLSTTIRDGVLDGRYDLGLFHAERQIPTLTISHLLNEPMFLIGPGREGARTARPAALKNLGRYPLLLPGPGHALRQMIDRLAEDHGVALDIRECVDSTSIIKRLVAAGLGYTVQCYSFVHEEVQRGELSIRPLNVDGLARNWSLAGLADRPGAGAVTAVAEIIREIAAELAASHQWRPPALRSAS
jgi:LysR family nitrogen assimilation transcriptional regulator